MSEFFMKTGPMEFLHFNCRRIESTTIVSAADSLYKFGWGEMEQRRLLKEEWGRVVASSPENIVLDFRGLPFNTPSIAMVYEMARLPRSNDQIMAVIWLPETDPLIQIHPAFYFRWYSDVDQAIAELSRPFDK